MNEKIKNLLKTIVFYVSIVVVTTILNAIAPGGPCTPGIGIFIIIFVAPVLTAILILRNLYLLSQGKKEHIFSFIIHIIMLFIIMLLFKF